MVVLVKGILPGEQLGTTFGRGQSLRDREIIEGSSTLSMSNTGVRFLCGEMLFWRIEN